MTTTNPRFLTAILVSASILSAPAWAQTQIPKPTLGSQVATCGSLTIYQYGKGLALQVPVDSSELDRAAELQFGRAKYSLRIKSITYQAEICEGDPSTFILSCQSNDARLVQFETSVGETFAVSLAGKASLKFSIYPRTIQTPWETFQDHFIQISAFGDNVRQSGLGQALHFLIQQQQLHSRVVCKQI